MVRIQQVDHSDLATADQLHRLMQLAYKIEAQLIGAADFPPLRRTAKEIQTASSVFYACLERHGPIAVIELEYSENVLRIASLVVHPEHARQGIGAALVTFVLEQILVKEESRVLVVQTAKNNTAAVALYEKLGFSQMRQLRTKDGFDLVELRY